MYLRLNFSWKSKALNLRQPKLSASYNESIAEEERGCWVFEIFRFFQKNGGVGKIAGVIFKKEVSLIFIVTNPFKCYLSLSVWWMCVLFIYTISISIIYVSQEETSFIASNQQISGFYKSMIFEKKRYCGN